MLKYFSKCPLVDRITEFELIRGIYYFRFNDFGSDGGPAAKELAPKLDLAKAHLSSRLGVAFPHIEVLSCLLIA